MPNPVGSYIWYELMTSDVDGAKVFYDAVVGWDVKEGAPEFGGYRMIGRADGGFAGGVLPITDDMASHGAKPGWLGYVYVDDVDRSVAAFEAAGGKAWMPATDIPTVGRVALVSDPQAAPIYVMKPSPRTDDPDAKSDVFSPDGGLGRCGWNELQTTDVEAARSFYADQFGWGSDEFMDMGEHGKYRFFDHDGTRIGALFSTGDEMPHWRYYFRVKSIADSKHTAEEKGGTIHMGPHQVPGGDWIVIGTDPQGAEFALVGGE
jgi:predicted enzyme related to lactoylglutathione lyase